jgi:hypothetical protein
MVNAYGRSFIRPILGLLFWVLFKPTYSLQAFGLQENKFFETMEVYGTACEAKEDKQEGKLWRSTSVRNPFL